MRTYEQDGFKLEVQEKQKLFDKTDYSITLTGPFKDAQTYKPKVTLLATFEHDSKRIWIEDIQGNGYYSGLHGKGIGKLMVNTLLQVVKNKHAAALDVKGMLSTVGDPDDSPLKEQIAEHREKFWQSFGFCVSDGARNARYISAKLADLTYVRSEKLVEGVLPTFIELVRFKDTQQ